jgi:1,4-alpha-glucan branching enzyme
MNAVRKLLVPAVLVTVTLSAAGCGPGIPEWRRGSDWEPGPRIEEGGVRFSLYEPKAGRVHLVGDFNNWSTTADPMYDREGDGIWTITMPLPQGRYEYKFLIDGEKWIPDPGGADRVDDGFGGLNSVLIIE